MKDEAALAKQYANTLLNLSQRDKTLTEIEKSFGLFVSAAYKDARFASFMNSPVVPQDKKEELLQSLLPKEAPILLGLFLKLVLRKKRFEILPLIEKKFQSLAEKQRGVRRAEFISANEINDSTKKKLISILENKLAAEIHLVSKIDPDLLGGYILKLDERVVDASYKTELRELHQQLSAAPI